MTNIGRMYLQLNDIEQAEEWINKALELRKQKLGVVNFKNESIKYIFPNNRKIFYIA